MNTAKNSNKIDESAITSANDQQISSSKARAQRKRISNFVTAVTSGMDKLGVAIETHLITKQTIGQSKQEDRGLTMVSASVDAIIVQIREKAL